MPAHMPSTATPVRYEFKAKSLWTKVDKAQPLKNLARRFAVAVRLYSRGVWVGNAPSVVGARYEIAKKEKEKARRCGRAVVGCYSILCVCGCFLAFSISTHFFRVCLSPFFRVCVAVFSVCAFVGGCFHFCAVNNR